jgi:glycogen phosphorylase
MPDESLVAYFTMEIGLDASIPTYAGGLGVLAGDTVRSAADLEIPMVVVTLLHRRGHFRQRLGEDGTQREEPVEWSAEDVLEPVDAQVTIEIEGRAVQVRAWRHRVRGITGFEVPVYLLDTALDENDDHTRSLTDHLYGGDAWYRLGQEMVLGLGGARLLRALGHDRLVRFHLNEGHAALIVLALVEERVRKANGPVARYLETVRSQCVFTTHTPVPAGHDQFAADLAERMLGAYRWGLLEECLGKGDLNMTELALRGSGFVNGVAMRHGEISRSLFPGYPVHSITNGVHVRTWTAPSFAQLYDRRLPLWRREAMSLRHALSIPGEEIWAAHVEAKAALLERVRAQGGPEFRPDALTLGFARRATAYKRGTLLFHDSDRLRALARNWGGLQVVFAGKAHPRDKDGKDIIRAIHQARDALRGEIPVVYFPDYDMDLGKLLCAGADLWLNTPRPPLEASGTSGMKAAVNGVPSLSVVDGWWVEGWIEGVTGWAIGSDAGAHAVQRSDAEDAAALYAKLGDSVLPCFYARRDLFVDVMRNAIAMNGAFFNTERMLFQYLHSAYRARVGRSVRADTSG